MTSYIRTILFLILLNIIFFQLSQSQDSLYLIATITGDSIGDQFSVVTGVGDVNGDGYDDVVVGAPGGNYAKLFLGGPVFDTIPDLIFYGEQPGSQFGRSVAGGKDINGDGFPDVIIGAPYFCFGGCMYGIVNSGKVYVYFGGQNIDNEPDIVINSYGWYYHFGYSLDIAGDLNGDGYNDLIISAPNDDYDAHGRVYIYFGGPHLDSTYDILLEGNDHFDMFGESVSGAGDVNGDDYDDFLVGAPQSLTQHSTGKSYLFYGGDRIGYSKSLMFVGDSTAHGQFGRMVAGLGDVNGDGYSDIGIMGLHKVNIYLGGAQINTIADLTLYPDRNFWYVGCASDLNEDGFSDYVTVSTKVKFYYGGNTLDSLPRISPAEWGNPVCAVGKINTDKHTALAFGIDEGSYSSGKVNIYKVCIVNEVKENSRSNPREFNIHQNYPNPFNNSTIIGIDLNQSAHITLQVFNVLGERVCTLINGWFPTGLQKVHFYSQGLTSGIYFYRLTTKYGSIQKSMILMR